MGQKVHPYGIRIGISKDWQSRWFSTKNYAKMLHEDIAIRRFVLKKLFFAGVPKVEIERIGDKIRIIIHTARPGIIIGRRGSEVDKLKDELGGITDKEIFVDIVEIKNLHTNAQLIAESIAVQLTKRASFKRVVKKSMKLAMTNRAQGIKVLCSGRLGGSEIARSEGYKEGKIPLHTFRANIDYGFTEARTTFGLIGVKVWVCKGEILDWDEYRKEELSTAFSGGKKSGLNAKKGKV